MLVPAMTSIGTCSSSRTLRTPMCARPRAPPPLNARPNRALVTPGTAAAGTADSSVAGGLPPVSSCAIADRTENPVQQASSAGPSAPAAAALLRCRWAPRMRILHSLSQKRVVPWHLARCIINSQRGGAMSNLSSTAEFELCVSEPESKPTLQVIPGRLTDLGGLPIRRLLPRSQRRTVGPWCFLDSYGPVFFSSGKPMDVPPHPHIGLQTVSWLLEGGLLHNDSLGLQGPAGPGVLNLMTAGRGIAHAEETSTENGGRLRGVQLWVALPNEARETEPAFEQHRSLPVIELEGGRATLIMGQLDGARSPARTFSPLVAADVSGVTDRRLTLP